MQVGAIASSFPDSISDRCDVAYELTLAEGLRFERRIFHGLFATNDQKEGKLDYAFT